MRILAVIFTFILLLITPTLSLAQNNPDRSQPKGNTFRITQPAGYGVAADPDTKSAEGLIGMITQNAITLIYSFAALAVIFYFLWGAVEWILSGGDKEKINGARRKMTHALIGLALLALSFVIIAIVGEIVGFSPLKDLQIRGLGDGGSPVVPNSTKK